MSCYSTVHSTVQFAVVTSPYAYVRTDTTTRTSPPHTSGVPPTRAHCRLREQSNTTGSSDGAAGRQQPAACARTVGEGERDRERDTRSEEDPRGGHHSHAALHRPEAVTPGPSARVLLVGWWCCCCCCCCPPLVSSPRARGCTGP